jgi:hypothetical protein
MNFAREGGRKLPHDEGKNCFLTGNYLLRGNYFLTGNYLFVIIRFSEPSAIELSKEVFLGYQLKEKNTCMIRKILQRLIY